MNTPGSIRPVNTARPPKKSTSASPALVKKFIAGLYTDHVRMMTSVASRSWLLTPLKRRCSSSSRTYVLICRMPARLSCRSEFIAEDATRCCL